ncbi:hypothetical protein VTO42DRAFT_2490 [Malbranchea cinnamomea]
MAENEDPWRPAGVAESAVHATSPPASHAQLLAWIESLGGGLAEGVEPYIDPEKGHCLRVCQNVAGKIASGTIVARCPITATISYLNLDPSVEGLPRHSFVYDKRFLEGVEADIAAAFLLMDQFLEGENSPWAPYIRSLPDVEKLTTTQFYVGEDLEWLSGTGLETARAAKMKEWKAKYDQGISLLKLASNPSIGLYSWEVFLWAMTIFSTRAFTSRVLKDFHEGISPDEDQFSVLVPLLDLSNHRPLTKVQWDVGPDTVGLRILEDLQPGKEIHNNYGPKNNESLMVNYGFCLGENTCEFRKLTLKAPMGSLWYEALNEQMKRFPENTDNGYEGRDCFLMNAFYPFGDESRTAEASLISPNLLDAMALIAANERDARTVVIEPHRVHIPLTVYGGSRSFLGGLCQLQFELFNQVVKAKRGGYLEKSPQNDKQRNAQIYRQSQMMLAQQALAITTWDLARAREGDWDNQKDHVLNRILLCLPEDWFGLPVRNRVKSLLQDRETMVKHKELFKHEDVIQTLPQETADCLNDFLVRITDTAMPVFEESQTSPSIEMFVYCLFIRFCVATYMHLGPQSSKTSLGSRIARWAQFLLESYPDPTDHELLPEDSDTDYLLTDLHKELQDLRSKHVEIFEPVERFTGPWVDTHGWLSRSSLRWSWYVAEDEFVQVPISPYQYMSGSINDLSERHLRQQVGDYYLYIPADIEESS